MTWGGPSTDAEPAQCGHSASTVVGAPAGGLGGRRPRGQASPSSLGLSAHLGRRTALWPPRAWCPVTRLGRRPVLKHTPAHCPSRAGGRPTSPAAPGGPTAPAAKPDTHIKHGQRPAAGPLAGPTCCDSVTRCHPQPTHKAGLTNGPHFRRQKLRPARDRGSRTTECGGSAHPADPRDLRAAAPEDTAPGPRGKGARRACASPGASAAAADSLQELGLQQALQTVAHHRLPEQGLLPALP